MNSFFAKGCDFNDGKVILNGENYKHITRVLRMKLGENISVCNIDNHERYLTKIVLIDSENVVCKIIDKYNSNELDVYVTLYQGLPKSDKMEFIIQKSVELGVYNIIPIEMKNCIAKIKDEDKKIKRWQSISESAAKQSKRNIIPKIENVQNLVNISNDFNKYDLVLVANENEKTKSMKDILSKNKKAKNIAIVVGPEGGITSEETKKLIDEGAFSISLGKRILRCETAPLTMLSMISYEFEQ